MRLSLEDYEQLMRKREAWGAAKGAGGNMFSLPQSPMARQFSSGTAQAMPGSKAKEKKPPVPAGAKLGDPGYVSPHGLALAALAKNPALLTRSHEHYAQVRVMDWAERHDPELYECLTAVPNGGKRHKKTAIDLLAEGVKRGYPDILVDYPNGVYHGARIELKANGGEPSEHQVLMLRRLTALGYRCALCDGTDEAIAFLVAYRALKPGEELPHTERDNLWLEVPATT